MKYRAIRKALRSRSDKNFFAAVRAVPGAVGSQNAYRRRTLLNDLVQAAVRSSTGERRDAAVTELLILCESDSGVSSDAVIGDIQLSLDEFVLSNSEVTDQQWVGVQPVVAATLTRASERSGRWLWECLMRLESIIKRDDQRAGSRAEEQVERTLYLVLKLLTGGLNAAATQSAVVLQAVTLLNNCLVRNLEQMSLSIIPEVIETIRAFKERAG